VRKERKTFDQLVDVYSGLTAFDWDQKDIKNLKHSPERELTPLVYWFWINSQFFPYNAQLQVQKPEFASNCRDYLLNRANF
jgi:hypothetical protein